MVTMVEPGIWWGGQSGFVMLIPDVSARMDVKTLLRNDHHAELSSPGSAPEWHFQDSLCGELQQSPGMYAGVITLGQRISR